MANITDLTGTTWTFNDNLIYSSFSSLLLEYSITFFGLGRSWTTITFEKEGDYKVYYSDGANRQFLCNTTTSNETYWVSSEETNKTIQITGGTDATNSDLISWLQANTTQNTPYQQVSLNSLNIHKVPSLSLWKEQYNVGINENDLVIISPQNLEDGVFFDLKDYDLYEKTVSGTTTRELWRKNTTPGTGYTKIGSVLDLIQGPKIKTITTSTNWSTDNTTSNYYQTISSLTSNITNKSKIDILPNQTIISQLLEDGVSGMYIENNNKVVKIYAIGAAPTESLTLSVSIQETI